MIPNILLATTCGSIPSTITCFLGAGPIIWFPVVSIAVTAIISIVAVIYVLAPLLGRNDLQVWARAKIYDALVTVVFALIFLALSTSILTINPVPAYKAIGLVPTSCDPSVAGNTPSSSNVDNLYGLSLCDLYQFNQNVAYTSVGLYWFAIVGGVSPELLISPSAPGFPIEPATGSGLGISFSIGLLPIVFVHQYVVPYMQSYFTAVFANQVLQILLSSSMLLFSLFLIIGLIARSFGITKSFGGAMIALGLGLGFVYPLMVSMTYGFIDVAMQNAQSVVGVQLPDLALFIVQGALNIIPQVLTSGFSDTSFVGLFTPIILNAGFTGAGLILIPLLNLVIVDAFIVDFSRAIGERMDLFSILTRIL